MRPESESFVRPVGPVSYGTPPLARIGVPLDTVLGRAALPRRLGPLSAQTPADRQVSPTGQCFAPSSQAQCQEAPILRRLKDWNGAPVSDPARCSGKTSNAQHPMNPKTEIRTRISPISRMINGFPLRRGLRTHSIRFVSKFWLIRVILVIRGFNFGMVR